MRKSATAAAGLLCAAALAAALAACGNSASSGSAAPSVSCTNYPISGAGEYHEEVLVRVSVKNTTAQPVTSTVDVDLTLADAAGSGGPTMHVTISGLVAANSSTDLSRKVLSTGKVQHCQITHASPP